jgi:3-hydroxyisobutyrate dehydrogenase
MAIIAFFGLGHMGLPMARNLVQAGHDVRAFDLSAEALAAARTHGLTTVGSAAEAVAGATAVITMLPKGTHVLDCYRPDGEIFTHAEPGALFIDSSTIDISDAHQAHRNAIAAGFRPVDAPVSGGAAGAAAATLTFMVGGRDADVVAATPILEAMGKRIVACGEAGSGQAAKVCNNMILGVSMIAVSEAFVLGESLGLSHQAMFDVVASSSGQCWSITSNCPVPGPVPTSPANNDYQPGFAVNLMVKDLLLAVSAADQGGADTALGRHAAQIFEDFARDGGDLDFSAVIQAIRGRSGTPARSPAERTQP